ncbi:uncharacterized protein LOC8069551 [Sorghum bicolor]|uniref:uncharacterized protein LOC8069551 n=1 Tax=Sorghum bicolor TaxID=4558 RepID=UPI000B42616E|nr:uncharacterized protein LOC8069551 [Sorghum bicolor]|eukprot:XP_021311848.1 uncharacterized protein LOC8069551 [Sorghum bicolor]
MDLKFCDISQIGRDQRCRDKINYEELSKLLGPWPDMCHDIKECSTVLLPYHHDRLYILFIIDMTKKLVYIMDPLSPNLKEKMIGDDRCSPYRDILSDVANHFNLAMKLANPAWKDNIFDWHREFPTWVPRTHNWKKSGFLAYNYLKKWNGGRLMFNTVEDTLRMEFLVDILRSRENECDNFPGELKGLLKQFRAYLYY